MSSIWWRSVVRCWWIPDWAQKVRDGREEDILPFSREALMTLV